MIIAGELFRDIFVSATNSRSDVGHYVTVNKDQIDSRPNHVFTKHAKTY